MNRFSLKKKDEEEKNRFSVIKKVTKTVLPIITPRTNRVVNTVSKVLKSEPVQKKLAEEKAISRLPIKEQAAVKFKQTGRTMRDIVGAVLGGASYLGKSAMDLASPEARKALETPQVKATEKKLFGKLAPRNETVQQFVKKDVIPFSEKYNLPKGVTVPVGVIGSIFFENPGNPLKGLLKPVAKDALKVITKQYLEEGEEVAMRELKKLIPEEQHGLVEEAIGNMRALKENNALDEDYLVKYVEENVPPISKESPKLSEDTVSPLGREQQAQSLEQVESTPLKLERFDSYSDDTTKLANSKLNLEHLSISPEARKVLDDLGETIKPRIEDSIGYKLSNKEAIRMAQDSAKILEDTVGRDETLAWEAAMLKARQKLSAVAETGKVDQDFIDNFMAIKTQGTDIARKLQSFSIKADPAENSSMIAILDAISKTTDDMGAVLEQAKGVDFNDFNQATEFYRKFVVPNVGEWIDLLRYNSMLSSPKTHLMNTISNLLNTTLVAAIEKTVRGGIDFLGSKIGGRERRYFTGEGGKYLLNYFKHIKEATVKFTDVMKDRASYTNLDLRNIPLSQKGVKGKIAKVLGVPIKLLEATDQFFMTLAEGAERGALQYRKSRGVPVTELKAKAKKDAEYRLYRQELHDENQGVILDAVDTVTALVQSARKAKNPIVSTIAKFTVPFLQTPMNILKQGIEYSPVGFTTMIKAGNKTEQLSKAIIGSAVFAGAATLLMSDRLTFGEPTGAAQKAKFRAEGKQPYAVKIGDKWVSFQKLPPAMSFPLAMVAGIDDAIKNQGMDENTGNLILSSIAKFAQFTADQSYAKNFGELLATVQGDEDAAERMISNYPQQLVPFRALSGWFARIIDDTQRKIDPDASFIDKQVQLLMMNIPGLSQKVPERVGPDGKGIENQNRFFNSLSPVTITEERKVRSRGGRSSSRSGGGSSGGNRFNIN